MEHPVAILGASSLIASDFILRSGMFPGRELKLYTRDPGALQDNLSRAEPERGWRVEGYEQFGTCRYSAILNFVGVGDPARARAMGREIFSVTSNFDDLVLAYLSRNPDVRYVFLSSGAVFGPAEWPVGEDSRATVPINDLQPHHYYGLAKLQAEAGHRSRADLDIIDVRIFNYISRRMDIRARFLVTEMIAAIRDARAFETSDQPLTRDFLHPADLCALLERAIDAPRGVNEAIDAYSGAPVTKAELIDLMTQEFGLRVRVVPGHRAVNASGEKNAYYSLSRKAARLGYAPAYTSVTGIRDEVAAMLRP